MSKVFVAAGGTGGHIYPGLAIAEAIKQKQPEIEIVFVGSYVGPEKDIIPQYGYRMALINAQGFEKGFSRDTLEAFGAIFRCRRDANHLLKEEKPDLVIGMGGFTCAMLLLEAARQKIPTLIHEQNSYPGRANRMLGRFVDRICITFEAARPYFSSTKTILTGNPVRESFRHIDRTHCRTALGLRDQDQLIVVTGGSQGAGSINFAVLDWISTHFPDNTVLWMLTGEDTYHQVMAQAEEKNLLGNDRITIEQYSERMNVLFGAADLVISRAGATSISELSVSGVASILVPYPRAAGDHQTFNAKAIAELGGAVIIPDDQLSGESLHQVLEPLLQSPGKIVRMGKAIQAFSKENAAERVAKEALSLISAS